MRMKQTVLAIITLCAMQFLALRAGAEVAKMDILIDGVPLPSNVAPVVEANAPFSGTWVGSWDSWLKTILIIEELDSGAQAKVVYAVADNPAAGFKRAWFRYDATIDDDTMTVVGDGFELSYQLSPTGRLRATFGDGFSFAVMERRKLDEVLAEGTQLDWTGGSNEMLETGLTENGKPIHLETVIYTPKGVGPFPLAIVNHGSTGRGTDPEAFKATWVNPWFADVLNERGYLVAFPQRRGRGRSEGLYDEGFATDRSRGYTCRADQSLAGAQRALQDLEAAIEALKHRPEVSDVPILLAGNSRGGVLAAVYAGLHPDQTKGVINFVGGWIADACDTAETINQNLFQQAARFSKPTIWFYGKDDPFYSINHSRQNFGVFEKSGGNGTFTEVALFGENNGHWVMSVPPLWIETVTTYLDGLDK